MVLLVDYKHMLRTKHNKPIAVFLATLTMVSFLLPQVVMAQSVAKPAVNLSAVGSALMGCLQVSSKIKKFITGLTSKFKVSDVAVKDGDVNFREACLNKLGYLASRIAIQQITNRTIAWINTGFDGNPFWTTEDQTFYNKISNTQIKELLAPYAVTKEGGQAFAKQIAKQIITDSKQTFAQRTAYTGPGKTFTQEFQNGGGWTSWMNLTQNQANDPLGFALLVTKQKELVVSQKIAEKSRELATNNGFLSQKKCVNPTDYKPLSDYDKKMAQSDSTVNVQDKESWISNRLDAGNVIQEKTDPAYNEAKYSAAFNKAEGEYNAIVYQATQKADDARHSVESSVCQEWKTVTPGKVISDQLTGVLGSPLRQSELADTINEQLGAVFDALLNQLAQKGLDSLSQKSSVNYKSLYPTNDLGFSSDNSTDIQPADSGDYWQNAGDQDNPFKVRAIIPNAIPIQNQFLDELKILINDINIIPEDIGELDYCVPGPTPNWREPVEAAINKITTFSYGDPSGDEKDKTPTYNYIAGLLNVNIFTDNINDVTFWNSGKSFEDKYLNGPTSKKVETIKNDYDSYSKRMEATYENQAAYASDNPRVDKLMKTMWNLRTKVADEISTTDKYINASADYTIQQQLTTQAEKTIRDLAPKYDNLFARVCANTDDNTGQLINAYKLPCACDVKLHPYIDLTLPDNSVSIMSPADKHAYRVKYYQVCKNAGYVQ